MAFTRHSVSCAEPEDDGEIHFVDVERALTLAASRAERDRELLDRLAQE